MNENPYEAPQVLDGEIDQPTEEERVLLAILIGLIAYAVFLALTRG